MLCKSMRRHRRYEGLGSMSDAGLLGNRKRDLRHSRRHMIKASAIPAAPPQRWLNRLLSRRVVSHSRS